MLLLSLSFISFTFFIHHWNFLSPTLPHLLSLPLGVIPELLLGLVRGNTHWLTEQCSDQHDSESALSPRGAHLMAEVGHADDADAAAGEHGMQMARSNVISQLAPSPSTEAHQTWPLSAGKEVNSTTVRRITTITLR